MKMSIGEVAARAGVRASTLRYYEKVGLLPKAPREGGKRRYDGEVLKWLAAIRVSQQAGFSVVEIRQIFFGFPRAAKPSDRWRQLAKRKLLEVEELVRRAERMKALLAEGIRCRCRSLQECTFFCEAGG